MTKPTKKLTGEERLTLLAINVALVVLLVFLVVKVAELGTLLWRLL